MTLSTRRRARNLLLLMLLGLASLVPAFRKAPILADEQAASGAQPGQSGRVWAWGSNGNGRLGDGTTTNRTTPVEVVDLTGVVGVAARGTHSLARRDDGTVWAWGANGSGQLGDGTTTQRTTPVQVLNLTDVVGVAAGNVHSLAVRENGSVVAWGNNGNGRLGDGTTSDSSTPVGVVGLTDVVGVAAGNFHSLAVRENGTVWAWGFNGSGQLGDDTQEHRTTPVQVHNLTNVVGVAAGGSHSLAVCANGKVWAWGFNGSGRLGDGSTTTRLTPVELQDFEGVVSVAAGGSHSLALRDDGTVWAWGSNLSGQLGVSGFTQRTTPIEVPNLTGVVGVAAGGNHSLAVCADGSVWAWGANGDGQLGDGTTTSTNTPFQVLDLAGVVEVAAGSLHSLALMAGNSDPIAVASIFVDDQDFGDSYAAECTGPEGAFLNLELDGSGSTDPDGDELSYEWSIAEDVDVEIIQDPLRESPIAFASGWFPLGVTTITLNVTDGRGGLGTADVSIVVHDHTPPSVYVTTDVAALWPANNKMVPVTIAIVATDACTQPEDLIVFCRMTSSQPDDSDGTGEHTGDVDGLDGYVQPVELGPDDFVYDPDEQVYTAVVELRAERDGDDKAGRVYSILALALDAEGNEGQSNVTVVVPHNRGKQK